MRVLVAGATGFIGRALVPLLQRDGHSVVVWARSAARARSRLGADVEIVETRGGAPALTRALDACDAVVNLAGETVMSGRWTPRRRARLRDSRVGVTEQIVMALAVTRSRPRVFVSGSAIGYYGDRADELLTESSPPGRGFLAELCEDWEAAALRAEALGLRVVLLRTGIVLGRDGGALSEMLPVFTAGLGGPLGTGRQFLSWIHLHDLARIIVAALGDERFRGPVNGVAPEPVTSRHFARALGRALRRPAVLPAPVFVLRALFGEAASALTDSQRVQPQALGRLGFAFEFPSIESALADIVRGTAVSVAPVSRAICPDETEASRRYLETRRPVYELRTQTVVAAPLNETFAFFSKAENLGMLTPAAMHFSISGHPTAIGEGTAISYRLRVGLVPIAWRSRIVSWMPGARFVDLQEQGPYRSWWHEHSFRAVGSSTLMEDRVCYAPPLGLLGRLVNRLFIVPSLRRIFQYRAEVIRLRFGPSP